MFEQPSDGLYNKLLWFDPSTKTEIFYYCIDGARVPGLLNTVKQMGVPIPDIVYNYLATVSKI